MRVLDTDETETIITVAPHSAIKALTSNYQQP
jgi:hypothetical protein